MGKQCARLFCQNGAKSAPSSLVLHRFGRLFSCGGPVIPLEVQVVIAKYQGEKRISSLPYILAVNANSSQAQLNIGAEVPVLSMDGPKLPKRDSSFMVRSSAASS